MIKVFNACWKPWYFRRTYLSHFICYDVQFPDSLLYISISVITIKVYEKVDLPPVVLYKLRWTGLDTGHVYSISGQNCKGFVENSRGLTQGKLQACSICDLP